jgi:pimeloyl-ACP methyl ester carboxylesterase
MKPVPLTPSNSRRTLPMQAFLSDGVPIAYLDEGPRDGEPIVLVHGFGSNAQVNWVYPGWIAALTADGRRVVALDNRGHGGSGTPRDPGVYHARHYMAEDVVRLMDHLDIERADLMGYSMGAWIIAHLAIVHPARVRSLVFGGLGIAMVKGIGGQETIAEALEAPDGVPIANPVARGYREFAEKTKSDRFALAACMRGSRQRVPADELGRLDMPVLVAVGTRDEVSGSAEELAALIPGAEVLPIPNRDHMLAVGDKVYKEGVLRFLKARP